MRRNLVKWAFMPWRAGLGTRQRFCCVAGSPAAPLVGMKSGKRGAKHLCTSCAILALLSLGIVLGLPSDLEFPIFGNFWDCKDFGDF